MPKPEIHPGKLDPSYKWKVLIVVMIGAFMAVLDSSIVTVTLPTIKADFGTNTSDVEWVLTGYMLAFAALMPLTAWLRDRIGYKVLFLTVLSIFTIGSLLCGMAWNLPSLIVARVIQALGGGAIAPTSMAMVTEVFPREERGKALGFWGLGIIFGPAIGPTLGGYLSNTLGWRSIFLVNLPVGIICFIIGFSVLVLDKPHRSAHRSFDLWGFIFLTIFIVSLLLGISRGEEEGWTSVYILTCWVVSIIGFTGFVVVETNVRERIIDISLFKIPVFTSSIIVTAVRSVALFGGTFLLPFFIQNVMGYNQLVSGLILLPSSLFMAILIPIAGSASDKIGPRYPVLIGIIFLMAFMLMYWNIDVTTSIIGIIIPTLIRSVGLVLLMAPVMTTMANSVPQKKTGMATSIMNIVQQLGGAIGIAIFNAIEINRAKFHTAMVGEMMKNGNGVFSGSLAAEMVKARSLGYNFAGSISVARGMLLRKLSLSAIVMSFQDTFIVAGLVILITIPMAFLMPVRPVFHPHEGEKAATPETGEAEDAVIAEF